MRCALVGADSLLIECGGSLLAKGHQIVVVAAGSERVAGWARSLDLPHVDASGPVAGWEADLAEHEIEWLFAITHLALLPDTVLALPTRGAVNFHDGPLPAFAGLNAPAWALIRGEEEYGVTWHRITSGVDQGDILKQRMFEIAPGETSLSLNTRNFEAAIETFDELVDELAGGRAVAVPQDPLAPRTTYKRLDRPAAGGILDWRRPARELDRLVRALDFGPYQNPLGRPHLWGDGGAVTATTAEVLDDVVAPAGEVIEVAEDRIVVACGEGALALTAFTTLRGAPMVASEAAAALAIGEGGTLPLLTDELVARVDERTRDLARVEGVHARSLAALEPLELPWGRTATAGHVPSRQTVPVEVPASSGADDDTIAAGFAVLLARLSGKDHFHLAVRRGGWTAADVPASLLSSSAVPWSVDLAGDQPLAEAVGALRDELGATRGRAPFAHDLIARNPDLVRVSELAAGRLLPVAVSFDADGEPDDGVVVELRFGGQGPVLDHDAGLLDPADAQLLAACLVAVLDELDASPSTPVDKVDLLGAPLRHRVLVDWNDTATSGRTDQAIHRLFEAQADRTPDTTAVIFEDRPVSYRELDERSNRLAHHLVDLGVGPDVLVGVHVGRGIDLVVAVVGIHKAGGAYVPLDPAYPVERLDHMIADSRCGVILTETSSLDALPRRDDPAITVVLVDGDRAEIDRRPATRPEVEVRPDHLAYCIYTSGSTGVPKGVLVEHGNVVSFFTGMDERVPHELPSTWFAVTSLSFDISVLELLYTLTRGFTVVVYLDRDRSVDGGGDEHDDLPMDFSLFYFSGDEAEADGAGKYRLLLDGARFADTHGFKAVWTPERHFHAFGGLYPQPAVTSAAVAAITENVHIRAGSVVLPLHHPIRVAEEWSVVDNLSNGRVGISIASGWQPNDFVLKPENHADAKQAMFAGAEVVQRLWRGESVTFDGPTGAPVEVVTLPRPVQAELPLWVTTAGNPDTYVQAGSLGANVLTHLLGQTVEQLAPKIEAYRHARGEAGFDPDAGVVTLMLHTFVGSDEDEVRATVREPLKAYLGTSFSLLKEYAWAFPAFQRPTAPTPGDTLADADFKDLSDEDLDAVLEFAFLRYYETSGLFGTPDRCRAMVDRLKGIGVGEIACLIDFGVPTDVVLASLPQLDAVRARANTAADGSAGTGRHLDQSVAAQLARHEVTHLQCTPSMARMLTMQDDSRAALAEVDHLFVGGEALPVALARDLVALSNGGRITNMYGPTETTIWSTTWAVDGELDVVPIGTPIAATQVYVLDRNREPVPPGVPGELWIGGAGVVRGYHERPELTAERFVPDPFRGDGARMYLTGDLARWRALPDGSGRLEFLGRLDHQVKIRGYRVELGEIEAQLGRQPGVNECVAVVREETAGDQQLVAYVSARTGASLDAGELKDHLRASLPDVMVPAHVVVCLQLPHTPNGKIDRNALPSLAQVQGARSAQATPVSPENDLERQVLAVWQDTLGATGIGVNDNFFDIGGHSLLIVRMHRRLKEELARPIPLTDLYRHPTVRGFAASLSSDSSAKVRQESLDRAARRRDTLQRRRVRR